MVRVKNEIVRLEASVESHRELLKVVESAKRQLESTSASLVAEKKRLRDQAVIEVREGARPSSWEALLTVGVHLTRAPPLT